MRQSDQYTISDLNIYISYCYERNRSEKHSLNDICRTVSRMTLTVTRLLGFGSINISLNLYVTKPPKSIEHPKNKLYTTINTVHTSQAL
jgi:hypothetical protein